MVREKSVATVLPDAVDRNFGSLKRAEEVTERILTTYKSKSAYWQLCADCAFLFSVLGFIALTITSLHTRWTCDELRMAQALQVEMEHILYYDEALTMSAWATALSGDLHWVDRYKTFLFPINNSIAFIVEYAPGPAKQFLNATAAANENLVKLETEVLDLTIAEGRNAVDRTVSIMGSEAYSSNKTLLREGLDLLHQNILSKTKAAQQASEFATTLAIVVSVLITILYSVMGAFVTYSTRLDSKQDEQRLTKAIISEFNNMRKTNRSKNHTNPSQSGDCSTANKK